MTWEVTVWWIWRTQNTLPAPSIFDLDARLAQTILLLEKEMKFLSVELDQHAINTALYGGRHL